jgi:hypothetical protein
MRLSWIWLHERGGERVAMVCFEFADQADTESFSITVPITALQSLNRFRRLLLNERIKIMGSEKPEDVYALHKLDQIARHLELMHPRIWVSMLSAAIIRSDSSADGRIMSWMCRDPKGDEGPPWDRDPEDAA